MAGKFDIRSGLFRVFFACFLFITPHGYAQTANTLPYDSSQGSPMATLQNITWIQGSWTTQIFGGIAEEYTAPPSGGSMMGVFKLITKGAVQFYEIVIIAEEKETLILRLKHFHRDLKGWEEKDKTIDFRLVKVESNRVYFENFTYERVDENHINAYVVLGSKEGKTQEVKFAYARTRSCL